MKLRPRWLKNTNGKPDAMLTFAFFSFVFVSLNVILSTFTSLSFGGFSVSFQSLDSSVMAVYLGSTFTAYVSRRWTDSKFEVPSLNAYEGVPEDSSQVSTCYSPEPTGSGTECACRIKKGF